MLVCAKVFLGGRRLLAGIRRPEGAPAASERARRHNVEVRVLDPPSRELVHRVGHNSAEVFLEEAGMPGRRVKMRAGDHREGRSPPVCSWQGASEIAPARDELRSMVRRAGNDPVYVLASVRPSIDDEPDAVFRASSGDLAGIGADVRRKISIDSRTCMQRDAEQLALGIDRADDAVDERAVVPLCPVSGTYRGARAYKRHPIERTLHRTRHLAIERAQYALNPGRNVRDGGEHLLDRPRRMHKLQERFRGTLLGAHVPPETSFGCGCAGPSARTIESARPPAIGSQRAELVGMKAAGVGCMQYFIPA